MLIGSIEAGGTKFVCGVGNEKNEILERISFPTTTPEETLEKIFHFFDQFPIEKMGIGSFGPIDVNSESNTYGYVLNTPKIGWKNFNFLGEMKRHFEVPTGWTTDVNTAVLAESEMGAAKGLDNVIYITVGTGIGAGALINGILLNGIGHPEMGHIMVNQHPDDDYAGTCPYHGNCLEGLAAGPSIKGRLNTEGKDVDPDHEVYQWIANYIGQALVNYTVILRPERIVLGGGVMNVPGILEKIKKEFLESLASYVPIPDVNDYLVLPKLDGDAGLIGGLILAQQAKK